MKQALPLCVLIFAFLTSSCSLFTNKAPVVELRDDTIQVVDGASNEAALVFVSPKNESKQVHGNVPITFLWDKPIFSLQDPAETQSFLHEHIDIEPKIEGSWSVVGTTGIVFQPKQSWKDSNQYTVSLDLGTFPDAQVLTFFTRALEMDQPYGGSLVHLEPLEVSFNQEVSTDLKKYLSFEPNIPGTWKHGTKEIWKEGAYDEVKDEKKLTFVPSSPWKESSRYTLTLATGAHGAGGEMGIEEPQKRAFDTQGPFSLGRSCDEIVPRDVYGDAYLSFTSDVIIGDALDALRISEIQDDKETPLDQDTLKEKIRDRLYGLTDEEETRYFSIRSIDRTWNATKTYRIYIDKSLKDIYGRSLNIEAKEGSYGATKEEIYCDFSPKFPTSVQAVFFPNQVQTYRTGIVPEFAIGTSGDMSTLKLTLTSEVPYQQSYTKRLEISSSPSKQTVHKIKIQEHFPQIFEDGNIPPGLYKLEITWRQNDYDNSRSTSFAVMDFPVELKKHANKNYTIYPRSFGDDPTIESFEATWYTSKYNQSKRRSEYTQCASLDACREDHTVMVLVRAGGKTGIGSTSFRDGISPYEANVDFGTYSYQQEYTSTPFTDRPLYRPGDQIHIASIFRERNLFGKAFPIKPVSNTPISYTVSIRQPDGKVAHEISSSSNTGDLEEIWQLPDDASFGRYTASIRFQGDERSTRYTHFYVTEFRKPTFLIEGSFDQSVALKGDTIHATIEANYAHGGALADKPVDYTVTLFGFEKQDGWFWFPREKKDKVLANVQAQLDESGMLRIPVDLSFEDEDEVIWDTLTVEATVRASDAQISTRSISVPFYASQYSVKLDPSSWFYDKDDTIRISGTIEDLDEEAVATSLQAVLLEKKWVRTDKKNHFGHYEREWETVEEEVSSKKINSDETGAFTYESDVPQKSGEYVIRFIAKDTKKREATAEQNFWAWIDGSELPHIRTNLENKILPLYPDKQTYGPGDTAQILFPHSEWKITRAHATVERGSVLQIIPVDIDAQTMTLKIEPWMAPNIYATLVIEGVDEQGNPHMKWGTADISIDDPNRELSIELVPRQQIYEPGETATLDVYTAIGSDAEPARITISIVDKTLLALKARDPLNLWKTFLAKLPLGVETFHALANYVSPTELEEIYEEVDMFMEKMDMAMGGGKDGDEQKPRGDFRDTAFFTTNITTDANGRATVEIPLPDNLTQWHVWALGHSEDNAFGEQEMSFATTLPLRIIPELPNIFRAGDETRIAGHIFRSSDDTKETVTLELTLPEEYQSWISEKDRSKKISMDGGDVYFSFPIEIPAIIHDEPTLATFTLNARDSRGNTDSVKISREILPPLSQTTVAELVEVNEELNVALSPSDQALKSNMEVTVFTDLFDSLDWIPEMAAKRNYGDPSSLYTYHTIQLLYNQLRPDDATPPSQDTLEEVRDKITQLQSRSGGLTYWPGSRYESLFFTTQVLEHAQLWGEQGVDFPDELLQSARKWSFDRIFRKCRLGDWSCPSKSVRLYSAYVLSRFGDIGPKHLEKLAPYATGLEASIWWLLLASDFKSQEDITKSMQKKVDEIETEIERSLVVRDRYMFWETGGSGYFFQNEALTSLVYRYIRNEEILPTYHKDVLAYLTQTSPSHIAGPSLMNILSTLIAHKDSEPSPSFPVTYKIMVNDTSLLEGELVSLDDEQSSSQELQKTTILKLSNVAETKYYTDIQMSEIFPAQDRPAVSKGFWIERDFFHIDDLTYEQPIKQLVAGESYRVRIRIVTSSTHRRILVRDPLISGVEAVNTDLDNTRSTDEDDSDFCLGWCRPIVQHREFAYDEARFFMDQLSPGIHELSYVVNARIPGQYDHLPIEVFEIDHPEVFATSTGGRKEIDSAK